MDENERRNVPFTVDTDGAVLVNGVRVLSAKGNHVLAIETAGVCCQRCCGEVRVPVALACRYDFSLEREMYWFAVQTPWAELARIKCRKCGGGS